MKKIFLLNDFRWTILDIVSSSILFYRFYRWSYHTTRLQNDTKVRRLKTIPLTNPYVERLTSWWGGGGEHILSRGGHLHFRTMENRIFLSSYTIFKQEMYVVSWHFLAKKNLYVVESFITKKKIGIAFRTSNSEKFRFQRVEHQWRTWKMKNVA